MNLGRLCQTILKSEKGNQWLRPVGATCDFRISHGTANSAHCTSPAALPWVNHIHTGGVFHLQAS